MSARRRLYATRWQRAVMTGGAVSPRHARTTGSRVSVCMRGGCAGGGWRPTSIADINTRPADNAIASSVVRAPCAATIELLPVSHHHADPPCPLRLLRPRRERPRRGAADQRDEIAASIKKTRSHGTIAKRAGLAKRARSAKGLPFSSSRIGCQRPVRNSFAAPVSREPCRVTAIRVGLMPLIECFLTERCELWSRVTTYEKRLQHPVLLVVDLVRTIEAVIATQPSDRRRGREHAVRLTRRLEARRDADGVAPDVVGELARADDPRHHGSGM